MTSYSLIFKKYVEYFNKLITIVILINGRGFENSGKV